MYGNTGPGDGTGTSKFVRVNSRGELMDGRVAELQSEETLNDSDKTLTVPAGSEWEVLSIYVELVTTATVGNRQMAIYFTDEADDIIGQVRAGAVQAASLTRFYQFAAGLPDLAAFRDTDWLSTPLPAGLVLPAGYKIRVFDKAAIDAAADDMDVQVMVKERLVP
jgi:hypothetical protein